MPHPYQDFLQEVEKPARYLGGEYQSLRKDWESVPIHVALAFPDAYEIGMSHLGMRILYRELNANPRLAAERVYAPWPDLEAKLRERGLPLVSLENARPLADFDVIGFSLQYELTFTNLLNMLDLAGIPLRAEDRGRDHPLIVAGGPVATQPEPLAPFIDCFVIGDGEVYFASLIESFVAWRDEGLPREEILVRLAGRGGVYCPALYAVETEPLTGLQVVGKPKRAGVPARVQRQIVEDLNRHPFPARGPIPSTEIVFDRFSMEIARGCTEGCRFCQAGMIYRPVRERDPGQIVDTVLAAVREGGYDETSLTSLSTADFSCVSPLVKKLMERLKEEKVSLSVSSLRAYGLPEDLLDAIAGVRNTSLTFAPEAGTQRMRDVIAKNISEADMEKSARDVFSRGWKRCKLYFMIGLPTEEDEDVLGIVRTAKRYLEIAREYHAKGSCEVTASVSSHVPKPHTPFQWAAMDDLPEIERKQETLQREAAGTRVRLKWHDARISHIESLVTRGDRRLADLIEYAFRRGCRFDGWTDQFHFEIWVEGLKALGLDRAAYLQTIPLDARLPWDHIDVGLAPGFLEREYRRALRNRLSPPCGKPFRAKVHHTNVVDAVADRRPLVCFDCGIACDMTRMREERIEYLTRLEAFHPPAPAPSREEPGEAARARNRRPRTAIVNAPSTRYRLLYTKLGPSRFLSHLDLVRLLPRVFRRAALPMTYSLGFHPKPKVTFSPALGLGFGSRGEVLDIHLETELDGEECLARLNRATPEGLEFLAVRRLAAGDPPLSRLTQVAEYGVELPARDSALAHARAAIERLRAGEPFTIVRAKAGAGPVDAAPAFVAASFGTEARPILRLAVKLNAAPAVRPDDLASALLGEKVPPQAIERLALWHVPETGGLISPLDLEAVRAASPAAGERVPA
jgi:radical SAM family uncharacterized protein/radical SAM-linked protein